MSCVSQTFVDSLNQLGMKFPILPTNSTAVVGALHRRCQKVTQQVYLPFEVQGLKFYQSCLIVPSLVRNVILGCDWLVDYDVCVDFTDMKIRGFFGGVKKDFTFDQRGFSNEKIEINEVFAEIDEPQFRDNNHKPKPYGKEEIEKVATNAEMFNESEKRKLMEILLRYGDVFSDQPGLVSNYYHEIKLHDETPFRLRSYPIPHIYKKAVSRQIKEMEEWGVIMKSQTEYISPLVVVKKKDGSPRVCIDARFLNSRMERDHGSPPNPLELLFNFSKGVCLSSLDLAASYWQAPD